MSDTEQSPKSLSRDSTFVDSQLEFADGKTPFVQERSPFLNYSRVEVVPGSSTIQKQPTAMDLIKVEDFILDPSTPRTPKHKQAEAEVLGGPAAKIFRRHMDAVVKVYCTHSKPNFELPWQMKQQTFSKSTGFAVIGMSGDRAVLTNAHSVTYGIQVQLKKRGDDERFSAKIVAVGNECDIALLTVDDEKFWSDIVPLTMSTALPELQESLCVLGYPIGGDSLAISAGVVSRVQMTHYSFGCMSLLALQTDAAINSGEHVLLSLRVLNSLPDVLLVYIMYKNEIRLSRVIYSKIRLTMQAILEVLC